MTLPAPQRRILCIRPALNDKAGTILTVTSDEWVEALALHATVLSIDNDFDFGETCLDFRPDLVILDAVNWTRAQPLRIANARAHPAIPRVLFLNFDPHDPMRPLTFRMAEELGVETVFITAEAFRQHMPALSDYACFFAPQFVDASIYRDHGLAKSIPVSVFGGHLLPGFYPWRARLIEELPHILPTMVFPHPGYVKGVEGPFTVKGEAYARVLSRSFFSAADTTRLDDGVRKHIEIPACGAVLLAPESDSLSSYGFVDLENCILGEGPALYDKITMVARQPDLYGRIRESGKDLVSRRYARTSWRFMLEWLDCHERLKPGQVVRQDGRYGPFHAAEGPAGVAAAPQRDNAMTAALRTARDAILTGVGLDCQTAL